VATRLQCYGSFVAVLAPVEPHVVSELMPYMGLIIRVSQYYEGRATGRCGMMLDSNARQHSPRTRGSRQSTQHYSQCKKKNI